MCLTKEELSSKSEKPKKKVLVLDTSALLAKYQLLLPHSEYEIATTSRVVDEVKDAENKDAVLLAISLNRVKVVDPPLKALCDTEKVVVKIGEHTSLSQTDISVAALALHYKSLGYKAIVITDDYALQNLLFHLGISFKPLRTIGIREARRYKVYCPKCGYVPRDPGEIICPICGSKLEGKKRTKKH
ncbi:MAG: nucleotide-binding protein [Staphylothermus sp.]|nr:nucleotide-binding protein [Staphylothermus sp.]